MQADRVYGFDPVYTGLSTIFRNLLVMPDLLKPDYLTNARRLLKRLKNIQKKTLMNFLTDNMPDEELVDTALAILGAHHEVAVPAISRGWQLSENPEVEINYHKSFQQFLREERQLKKI